MKKNKIPFIALALLIVSGLIAWFLIPLISESTEEAATASKADPTSEEKALGTDAEISDEASEEEPMAADFLLSATDAEIIAWGKDFGIHDPIAGLAFIEALDPESDAAQLFVEALFAAWTEREPIAVVEHLLSYWHEDNRVFKYLNYMTLPLEEWARTDPLTAMTRFQELSVLAEGKWRMERATEFLLSRALGVWAETAPQESFTWLVDQGNVEGREMLLTAVIDQWAKVDPLTALDQLHLFDETSNVVGIIRDIGINSWSTVDAYAASEWALANVPNADFEQIWGASTDLTGRLYTQYSGEAAMQWIDKIEHESIRKDSLGSLIFSWSSSPEEGTQLLDAFAQKIDAGDALYESKLSEAALKVAEINPIGVAEWLNSQEEKGQVTDRFSEGLVDAIMDDAPDIAYAWVENIQDQNLKSDMTYFLLTDWGYTDHEGLSAWIEETQPELTPQLQEELQTIIAYSAEVTAGLELQKQQEREEQQKLEEQ